MVHQSQDHTQLPPLKTLLHSIPLPRGFLSESSAGSITNGHNKLPILLPPLEDNGSSRGYSSTIPPVIRESSSRHMSNDIYQSHHHPLEAFSSKQNTSNPKVFACQQCGKSFTTSDHLSRHIKSVHIGEKNYACPLPGCSLRFSRKDNCMQHYRTHQDKLAQQKEEVASRMVSISNYTRMSSTQSQSQSHQSQGTTSPPPVVTRKYKCTICQKLFVTSGHLSRHSRIHTGEKNHVCPYPDCSARFSRKDNCMQHYKTHLNDIDSTSSPDSGIQDNDSLADGKVRRRRRRKDRVNVVN